jgi:hypothetical protein
MTELDRNTAHIPTLSEVTEAYGDIVAHNKRYTNVGAALANAIVAMTEVLEAETSDDWHERAGKRVVEGEGNADLQELFHEDTFTRIGIKMLPWGMQVRSLRGYVSSFE